MESVGDREGDDGEASLKRGREGLEGVMASYVHM